MTADLTAAITAGGRVEGLLARDMGTDVKALAPCGARGTLLDRSIEAAVNAGATRIVVIGGEAVREHCGGRVDDVIPERRDGGDNLAAALESAGDMPLLLMTSDLPFVTGEAVGDFLARARDCDVAIPLARESAYRECYPGAPPHVTVIGRERIVNGCAAYFAPGVAPRALDVARRLFAARKNLWRMAMLLGPGLLARFALGRLEIAHVERHARHVLGIEAWAIRESSPALCYDVDTPEDYRYAERLVARG